ncbi:MAG TPA: response regulator [Segetibacter sp.]|nr:response regulator [Segetibacter sp.]
MSDIRNRSVMIVDDVETNIFALSCYLETLDIDVIVAKNGEEAIKLLEDGARPGIILLDMMMPVMDGYETLKILKRSNRLKEIPVIAVTARAMKGDKEKCLEAGAWDYISKPIDLKLLNEKITKLIGQA